MTSYRCDSFMAELTESKPIIDKIVNMYIPRLDDAYMLADCYHYDEVFQAMLHHIHKALAQQVPVAYIILFVKEYY